MSVCEMELPRKQKVIDSNDWITNPFVIQGVSNPLLSLNLKENLKLLADDLKYFIRDCYDIFGLQFRR